VDALAENAAEVLVVAARIEPGQGPLSGLPVTVARLREDSGGEGIVRIVGGTLPGARAAHLAGFVVPVQGMRVRRDLRDVRHAGRSPAPSHAFVQDPSHALWSTLPVSFALAAPGSRDLGLSPASDLAVAAESWAHPSCSGFRATVTASAVTATPSDDGQNVVFFEDSAWPAELVPHALGQTVVHQSPDGSMHDADILLNGAEFRFSLQGGGATVDVRSVLTHELGHALGLAHSPDPTATMFPTLAGRAWRSLEADDRAGVCALYPGSGNGGCDVTPCPSGFACVSGACQRPHEPASVCAPCARVTDACEGAGVDARCVDLPSQTGRVCGRACDADRPCGKGFSCAATTSSGDYQCIAADGCRSATNACKTDADCKHAEVSAVCVAGACAGKVDADAGATGSDAGRAPDAGPEGPAVTAGGGGCSQNGTRPTSWSPRIAMLVAIGLAGLRRRARRA
jgi:hypothetical protein